MQWHRQACKTLQQKNKPGQCQTYVWDDAVQTQKKLSLYHTPTQQLHQKALQDESQVVCDNPILHSPHFATKDMAAPP